MLSTLFIKNFAIIDELTVNFIPGLNLITGETGAGKSIIINALKLLLGGKFSREYFRTGKDKIVIEGSFENEHNMLVIRRVFTAKGSSRAFLNDEPSSVEKIKKAAKYLIDLHGQHEQQRLLDSIQHIDYLDSWGTYQQELEKVKSLFDDMENYSKKIKLLKTQRNNIREKAELYKFQLQEITQIDMTVADEIELQESFHTLTNSAALREWVSAVLYLADEADQSIQNNLSQIEKFLQKSSAIDCRMEPISSRFDQISIELTDIANELKNYLNTLDADERLLEEINQKISYVEMLKRKYGGSFIKVLEYRDYLQQWLKQKSDHAKEIRQLEEKLVSTRQQYLKIAKKISKQRKTTAALFDEEITQILYRMDMKNTVFKTELTELDESRYSRDGIDSCQFVISTNLGEDLKPLNKVVSGGEISRIMLAIKIALQGKDKTSTLFFDEVDTGISGATAERIGEMIQRLSQHQQIICITHLPQIASKGNHHFKVYKDHFSGFTSTSVKLLNPEERVLEIAGLISGKKITDSGIHQATKLLGESVG